ncbi:MAG: hypothetical protein WBD24_07390 [Candidatus Omnitrophota bacterium]
MRYYRASILTVSVMFCFGLFMIALAGCGPVEGPKGPTMAQRPAGEAEEAPRQEPSTAPITEERTYYDFEGDLSGWEVPMWAMGKSDYVAKDVTISEDVASHGKSSMKMEVDFPGGTWTAGLVEIQQYLDMSRYRVIGVDIYLPKDAPIGLKAKLILTVGSNWKFVEMSRSVPLIPGEWATITANIEPGSYDWKRVVPDEKFAEDVRKIAIRIESNRKPAYTGVIYVDNVRVGR